MRADLLVATKICETTRNTGPQRRGAAASTVSAPRADFAEPSETWARTTIACNGGAWKAVRDTQRTKSIGARRQDLRTGECRTKAWGKRWLADQAIAVIVTGSAESAATGQTGLQSGRTIQTKITRKWRHRAGGRGTGGISHGDLPRVGIRSRCVGARRGLAGRGGDLAQGAVSTVADFCTTSAQLWTRNLSAFTRNAEGTTTDGRQVWT